MDGPLRMRQILRLCVLAQLGRVLISGPRSPLEREVSADAPSPILIRSGLRVVKHQAQYWPICEALRVGEHARCDVALIT